jgi:hypothetical protein
VVTGASNLQNCIKHFADLGYKVVGHTTPGWVVSSPNVERPAVPCFEKQTYLALLR